ncbi:ABC transporter substrate-binding protein [Frigoribacterium sp. PhB24]|uniref:ABC transporter substrate-binding protein n=1 Tax=Frigoribacterium sp. PhB24 TaxID=2485204 RepID=UPI000FB535DD|nr:ABC transporter substrate-binding protein [Frigoribacterium sp. PhB24]ROS48889.1 raffinose/stachyose/melibiose transport system substrate-binding protein [Frigoribacterium sp. PhB24]
MRKAAALVPAAVLSALALGLAGCSAGPQSAGGGDENTLTVSGWSGDEVMSALASQFEDDNPGVTVEITELPWPNILTQINTEMVSGTASDFVVVFPGNGNPITAQTLAKGNFLEDLSSDEWTGDFTDVNKAVMGADGKILMGSNNFTIIPATYNTQALEALGATAPTTWTEVLDLCSAAKAEGKVAYALAGLAGGTFNYLPYALSATLVDGADPDFASEQASGDATFADSEWSTVLDKYLEMMDAGCFTADALGTSLEVAQGQVATGDAVGIVTVSNQIGDIERAAPEGSTFETAPLPATDDPSETVLPVGLGSGYGVNAKAKNKDLANKFMDFYLSEQGVQLALDTGSIFPSVPVDGFEPTPALVGVSEQAQSDKTAAFPDQTWPNSNTTKVYQDELQKLLGGQTSVDDALAAMDSAYAG